LFRYNILDNNYGNQISLSLKNIEKSLKEISDCYIFFKKSYNAYKHGYQLWVGKEHDTEAAIFRNKNGSEDHILLDENSIELVMNSGKYCLSIFAIIKNNHKSICDYLTNPQIKRINISFLLDNNLQPERISCETA
jgi:hypothetical protein